MVRWLHTPSQKPILREDGNSVNQQAGDIDEVSEDQHLDGFVRAPVTGRSVQSVGGMRFARARNRPVLVEDIPKRRADGQAVHGWGTSISRSPVGV